LYQEPVFLFNIAQCHRQLGEYEEAANFYRSYRREAANPPNREDVDRLIAEMDRAAAERRAKQPPTGTRSPEQAKSTEIVSATPKAETRYETSAQTVHASAVNQRVPVTRSCGFGA
jgi:hypothetical protein